MLYRREGFPEENELVLCTVTKIFHHSVFVHLDEYEKGGMIHISEISPGRIRNIRDYVVEGKKVVCKVLRVTKEKGYIDLSLRRVTERQRRDKQDEIKQEMKAEKVIEMAAEKLGRKAGEVYEEVGGKIFEKYEYLYQCFKEVAAGKVKLEEIVDKKLAEVLEKIAREKFKPQKIQIGGVLELKSYAPEGVEVVKKALEKAEKARVSYAGGGRYKIAVEDYEYKKAEKVLEKITGEVIGYMEKEGGEGKFERE